jgi:hypothetical protein
MSMAGKEPVFSPYRFLELPFFASFAPLADVAKGGDGAKSAFCGYPVFYRSSRIALNSARLSKSFGLPAAFLS